MRYHETCPHCGNQTTAYTHNLNKTLVSALDQLVTHYYKQYSPVNLQQDLDLTKNQYNNFQKLQYFGLVRRTTNGYYPTSKGISFTAGLTHCQNKVATLGKRILENDHPAWETTNVSPETVMIWDIDERFYKRREDYQKEKSNQIKLF